MKDIYKKRYFLSLLSVLLVSLLFSACPAGDKVYLVVARYDTNGKIDNSFGKEGIAMPELGNYSVAYTLNIQPDGRIIAAGISDSKFTLIRLNPDGNIDESFANKGVFTNKFGSKSGTFKDVIIQPDGKIVTTGLLVSKEENLSSFVIVRFNPDGSIDEHFGEGGTVIYSYFEYFEYEESVPYTIKTDNKGRILVAGKINSQIGLIRYNREGSLDYSFGYNGVRTFYTYAYGESPCDILLNENGSIILAGGFQNTVFIGRLNESGEYNDQFEGTELITSPIVEKGYFEVRDVLIQKDGSILVAGHFSDGNIHSSFGIARFTPDGEKDINFGSNGLVMLILSRLGPDYINSIYVQSDGKILVAGSSAYDFAIVRLKSNGSIDETFGNNGIVTTELGSEDVINSIIVQPDGKILVGGYSDTTSGKY